MQMRVILFARLLSARCRADFMGIWGTSRFAVGIASHESREDQEDQARS